MTIHWEYDDAFLQSPRVVRGQQQGPDDVYWQNESLRQQLNEPSSRKRVATAEDDEEDHGESSTNNKKKHRVRRSNEAYWEENMQLLLEHQQQHGHVDISKVDDPVRAKFLEKVRYSYRKYQLGITRGYWTHLTPDRKQQWEDCGFAWTFSKELAKALRRVKMK